MNRLQSELCRLYLLGNTECDSTDVDVFSFANHKSSVRAMTLELARPADWSAVSALWQGVQADLELPAPAIAVNGIDGYQLWFSFSDPVPGVDAKRFLEYLRLRYWSNIAPERIDMWPPTEASVSDQVQRVEMVPVLSKDSGRWSAFIASDLASVFADEPWLEICPSPDAQADVLSRLVSIKSQDFQRVIGRISTAAKTALSHVAFPLSKRDGTTTDLDYTSAILPGNSPDPKRFLLEVMGNSTVELHLRIKAAQALLPYFENQLPVAT